MKPIVNIDFSAYRCSMELLYDLTHMHNCMHLHAEFRLNFAQGACEMLGAPLLPVDCHHRAYKSAMKISQKAEAVPE